MKHTKVIEIPATQRTVIEKTTCDFCGTIIRKNGLDIDEVTITHRTGWACSEGGSGHETSVDVCGRCFVDRIVPWLKSQGVTPVTKEWDW